MHHVGYTALGFVLIILFFCALLVADLLSSWLKEKFSIGLTDIFLIIIAVSCVGFFSWFLGSAIMGVTY